jgi:type II secretory pathway component PulF
VFPKFIAILEDLEITSAPLFSWAAQHSALLIIPIVLATLLTYLAALFYVGGPRLVAWLGLESGRDWLRWRVPWQRKRLDRDFSTMLALLLDAGVPEDQAITLAAESTGNRWFQQKALILNEEVRRGVKLTEAVSRMDESGEFGWRFANAVQAGGGFQRALSGWHDSLEARAFRQEQATAQALTSLLVLFNGLVVGLLAVAVFQSLIAIIQEGLLW